MYTHICFGCLFRSLEEQQLNQTLKAAEDIRIETAAIEARFQEEDQLAESPFERARARDKRSHDMFMAFQTYRERHNQIALMAQTRMC